MYRKNITLSNSTDSERTHDLISDEDISSGVDVSRGAYTSSASAEDDEEEDEEVDDDEEWENVGYAEDDIEPSDSASRPRAPTRHPAHVPRPRRSASRQIPVDDPPPRSRNRSAQGRAPRRRREYQEVPRSRQTSIPDSLDYEDDFPGHFGRPPQHPPHPSPQWSHVPHNTAPYAPSMASGPYGAPFHPPPHLPDSLVPYPRGPDPYGYPNPFDPDPGRPNAFGGRQPPPPPDGYFREQSRRNPRYSMPHPGAMDMMAYSPNNYYPQYPPYMPPGYPMYPPPGGSPPPAPPQPPPPPAGAPTPASAHAVTPEPPPPQPAPQRPPSAPAEALKDPRFEEIRELLQRQLQLEEAKQVAAKKQAEDAKKQAELDKLRKLEELLFAQKDEAAKREEAMLKRHEQYEAAAKAQAAKEAAARAVAEKNEEFKKVALAAHKKAEDEFKKKEDEAKEAHNKEMAAAKEAKEKAEAAQKAADEELKKMKPKESPIRFKDAVGRKFQFPWSICKTWRGMEDLIKQAFLHVDVIGPHVHEGHYDLLGPDGVIILPQVWETMIKPDWEITMKLWPMEDPKKKEKELAAHHPFPPGMLPPLPLGMPTIPGSKGKKGSKSKSKMPFPPVGPPPMGFPPPPPGMPMMPPPPPGPPMHPGAPIPPHPMMPPTAAAAMAAAAPAKKKKKPVASGLMRWAAGPGRVQSTRRSAKKDP
ncbi:hypothetical protein P152DRAFT_199828 [Eremomyces bilateralis CBS 781.70]|uniref:Ubiquitin-like domain-containing protein n=1 Tax=Eremomyces bilateralis CBS 781.70 TaxID=1392243 RepID=A0A6G1GDB4_9PEZI|nr:uncharacterized protein P152DRAFT_199828 [Eremomyces bilateralis CBS 781.70]KAF1815859.1 hypothetical protein P152DRAFT_199828 [Eremomyces bilateralis CBS 781.70]